MRDGVLIVGKDETVLLANDAYRKIYDIGDTEVTDFQDVLACQAAAVESDPSAFVERRVEQLRTPAENTRWELSLTDGRRLLVAQHPMSRGGMVIVETDITALYEAQEENRQLQMELMQRHKTEALGTLAGGMAHEINTPVQFISDNVTFLAEGVSDVFGMIEELADGKSENQAVLEDRMRHRLEEIDWTFLRDEIPGALDEMSKGASRVRDLIATFKQFAAPTSQENELEDLVDAVRTTIEVGKSEWDSKADVKLEAPDHMPRVPCKLAQINQAVHSLLSNAADAIEDCADSRKGLVKVRLGYDDDHAWIEISDNGCGIPVAEQRRIFDALYTTKEPGRGTGHGLALCQSIVTRNHNGRLTFESTVGEGTAFKMTLPLRSSDSGLESAPMAEAS